jgi:hypothetical protein
MLQLEYMQLLTLHTSEMVVRINVLMHIDGGPVWSEYVIEFA